MTAKPDILVSIDLGTTFTGVAWMTPRTPLQVISNWPGDGGQDERKVPTTLIYNPDGTTVSSWGFLCAEDQDVPGKVRRECFKVFLDDPTLAAVRQKGLVNAPRSTIEAQRFVTDYLGKIYMHVKETVESEMGRQPWKDKTVIFLFSVPTTWENLDVVNVFKGCILDAGFESGGSNHSALVDLTEAEAAAVATLKTSPIPFENGNLFLTVDAGGGTTDLALMRITSIGGAFPQMSQVTAVNGLGVGGSLIDLSFMRLVQQRMAAYPDVHFQLPRDLAARMSRSPYFLNLKHKFGQRVWMQSPVIRIQMEGVSHDFSHAGLGIHNGCMLFAREEIQLLFDVQVQSIILRIDEQLGWVTRNAASEQVGDVVCPNSPLVKRFEIRLSEGETTRSWNAEIVTSQNEVLFLPRSLKQAGAVKLCDVKSNLDGVQQTQLVLKHKRGTCFSRGYTFYLCQFEIRVIVAPADLRFELWFGGQRFSGNHEPIKVIWGSA